LTSPVASLTKTLGEAITTPAPAFGNFLKEVSERVLEAQTGQFTETVF